MASQCAPWAARALVRAARGGHRSVPAVPPAPAAAPAGRRALGAGAGEAPAAAAGRGRGGRGDAVGLGAGARAAVRPFPGGARAAWGRPALTGGFSSARRGFASDEAVEEDGLPPLEAREVREVKSPKVAALAEEILGLSLLEVAELSDILKDKLGLGDLPMGMPMGMPMAAPGSPAGGAAAAPAEEPAAEKTTFDVKLKGFDAGGKLKVIKEVRALLGLGLKESKELVEKSAGEVVDLKLGASKEEADAMKEKLAEVGADVVVE